MIVGMGWFEGGFTAELSGEGGAQGGAGDRHRAPPSELRVQVRRLGSEPQHRRAAAVLCPERLPVCWVGLRTPPPCPSGPGLTADGQANSQGIFRPNSSEQNQAGVGWGVGTWSFQGVSLPSLHCAFVKQQNRDGS